MTINLKRLIHLIITEIRMKGGLFLLIAVVSFAFLFYTFSTGQTDLMATASSLVNAPNQFSIIESSITQSHFKFHLNWFSSAYFTMLVIFTSLAFSEYHDKRNRQFQLSLPASLAEKWSSKFIIYIILIPIVILLLYMVFAHFSYGWNEKQVRLGLTDPYLWKQIKPIIPQLCVIFLAALFFKKFSFFKIMLAGIVLYICKNLIEVITFVVSNDSIALFSNGGTPGIDTLSSILGKVGYSQYSTESISYFLGISQLTELSIIAVLALIVSFIKFRELES